MNDQRAQTKPILGSVPPYVPENLRESWVKLNPPLELIRDSFMQKVEQELADNCIDDYHVSEAARTISKHLAAVRIAFEVGFLSGASFISENPDL